MSERLGVGRIEPFGDGRVRKSALDFVDQPKKVVTEMARRADPAGKDVEPTPEDLRYYDDLCLLLKIEPAGLEDDQRDTWKKKSENGKSRSKAAQRLGAQGLADANLYIKEENIKDFPELNLVRRMMTEENVDPTDTELEKAMKLGVMSEVVMMAAKHRREAVTKVKNSTAATAGGPTNPNIQTGDKKVFYPQLGEDLTRLKELSAGLGIRNPDRDKNMTEIRLIRRRLEREGVKVDALPDFSVNPMRDRVAAIEQGKFKDAITLVSNKELRDKDPEFWKEHKEYLESCGVDVEALVSSREKPEADPAVVLREITSRYGIDTATPQGKDPNALRAELTELLRKNKVSPGDPDWSGLLDLHTSLGGKEEDFLVLPEAAPMSQQEKQLREYFATSLVTTPDKRQRLQSLVRAVDNYARRNGMPPVDLIKEIDNLRTEVLAGDSEIGEPGEIELNITDRDPLQAELNKPLPGDKYRVQIVDQATGMPRTVERAALKPEKYLSIAKLRTLLVDGWKYEAAKLLGESNESGGNVGSSIRASSGSISNLVERIRISVAEAQAKSRALAEIFPSLKVRDGDPLATRHLYDYFQSAGFDSNDPKVLEIPEVKYMSELEKLLEIQEALATEAGVLSRLRGVSEKIESMAEVVIPLPSGELGHLWTIGKVFEGKDEVTGWELKTTEDYQDTIMRLYWAIAKVSDLKPGEDLSPEDRVRIPVSLENIIRKYLTVSDEITNEDGLKKETYVLSRWSNLPEEKKKLFDEFVFAAARFNLVEVTGRNPDATRLTGLLTKFDMVLRNKLSDSERVSEILGATKNPIDAALKFAKLRADTDVLTLGMAEQMGSYVLRRSIKQKAGAWDTGDFDKAVRNKNLYVIESGGFLVRVVNPDPNMPLDRYVVVERKVVGYPVSSDMVKVAQARSKLESGTIEGTAPGSKIIEYLLKKNIVPEVWIANYLQNTKVVEGGAQKSLWDLWWGEGKKLSDLAGVMVRADRDMIDLDRREAEQQGIAFEQKGAPGDAFTKWLKSRKAAFNFYDKLTNIKPEDYKGMFGPNGVWAKLDDYMRDGLALPDTPHSDKAEIKRRIKTGYVAMVLAYVNGLSREQSALDLKRNIETQNSPGSEASQEVDLYLRNMFDPEYGILDEWGRRFAKSLLLAYGGDLKRLRVPEGAKLNIYRTTTLADAFRSVEPLYGNEPTMIEIVKHAGLAQSLPGSVVGSLKTTLRGFTGQ